MMDWIWWFLGREVSPADVVVYLYAGYLWSVNRAYRAEAKRNRFFGIEPVSEKGRSGHNGHDDAA